MVNTRIKISSVIENQLPSFVRQEFPLVEEFLGQYYSAIDNQGSCLDILQNIDQYVKIDSLTNLIDSTYLSADISVFDKEVFVTSTSGFPEKYGLIQIGSEILTYTSKTQNSFQNCVRGFSGVTSLVDDKKVDQLVFTETKASDHYSGDEVKNLSILFLKEFFKKIKKQILPGFENQDLYSGLDERLFVKQSKDFYSSKGTSSSFVVLFKALYGDIVEVIRPSEYLIKPSNAQYRVTQDLVVESIEGDPILLINGTLYQDKSEYTEKASGTITNVERIGRGNKDYYIISFDYDYDKDLNVSGTIYGKFSISPKTKTITEIKYDRTIIDVDSTVGFPSSGNLIINLENGTTFNVNYKSKTLTQFLDCSGIEGEIQSNTDVYLDTYAYGYVGIKTDNIVKVRLTGVLSDLDIPKDTKYYSENDTIEIKTLGDYISDNKFANWFYNVSTTYNTKSVKLIDSSDYTYRFVLYDNHILYPGDKVRIIPSFGGESSSFYGTIVTVETKKIFTARVENEYNQRTNLNLSSKFTINKILSRVNSSNYPELSSYTSNIQNVYLDSDKSLYIASPSLPTYLDQPLNINNRSVTFSGSFDGEEIKVGEHKFYTGDSIVYLPVDGSNTLNIAKGIYFVYRVNSTTIKLSRSRENIFTNTFISVLGTVTNNKLVLSKFFTNDLELKDLQPQRLLRKLQDPTPDRDKIETSPGAIGMFVNGVELYNYKSNDLVYYGPIQKIDVLASGDDYDIINPPVVNIIDSIGYGATSTCSVTGSLKRIDIVDPGFNYTKEPVISISGGNGKNASARANLVQYDHEVYFNSEVNSGVNVSTDTIGFSTYHKFKTSEKVIYNNENQLNVGGLTNGSLYYVGIVNEYAIKLHTSFDDCISGINTVNITSLGTGVQKLTSVDKKRKISYFTIENEGSGYQNKKRSISSSGINTASNEIVIKNHGYSSGEIINYYPDSIPISGLGTGYSYYVTKVDDDRFKLSQVGVSSNIDFLKTTISSGKTVAIGGTIIYVDQATKVSVGSSITIAGKLLNAPVTGVGTTFVTIGSASTIGSTIAAGLAVTFSTLTENKFQDFYYQSKQYIDFKNSGSGTHTFNYPPIKVSIKGNSSISGSFDAIIQPIFRGSIDSLSVDNGGSDYGSEEVINYNRQPQITLNSGSGAQLTPIILGGRIVKVIINKSGFGYNSSPSLIVRGNGIGAVLTPIIEDGIITKVNIISSGGSYGPETVIDVVPAGFGAKFQCQIKSWRINNVERLVLSNQITDDDGFIVSSVNKNYGLQYSHLYSPRKLRSSVLSTKIKDGSVIYVPDIQIIENKEVDSVAHSPIIGWAYDGNPIYGPNAYTSKTGGVVRTMKSGYSQVVGSNRPDTVLYPIGFFVEDYQYTASGDLDEYNGRFCITPEYPNGVYAYFCTINSLVESSGIFNNYKRPVFPYVIGNYYKSKPIDFNYDLLSNQDDIDINKAGWLRNTAPYNLLSSTSNYEYITNSNLIKKQVAVINNVEIGGISSVGIFSGGSDYRVNETISFENEDVGRNSSLAKISSIKGKDVNYVEVQRSFTENIEFLSLDRAKSFIGLCSEPHNLSNNDVVIVTTDFDNEFSGKVKINENKLVLSVGVESSFYTGIVTYFNVSGNLEYPNICEDDIYEIENEKIKILSVDLKSSRIKVLRGYDGTVSISSYFSGSVLTEVPRKFQTIFGISTSYNFVTNREFYFNPKESVGVGTTSSVGIVSTLYFSNPGSGITQISIPPASIYLPGHKLTTGTTLIYSSNGGTRVSVSTNGVNSFQLSENQKVYVAKLTNDLIGISTIRVGLGTLGSFVGIGSIPSMLLYFTGIGTGNNHSFKTDYSNVLRGTVEKNVVRVSTSSTHGLDIGDKVTLSVKSGITTTVKIVYNDFNRRLICNSRSFISSDIDVAKDIIKINNHGLFTGQKVLYTSNTPSLGLSNQSMYYVVVVDGNKIKLSDSYYGAMKNNPEVINIRSSSSGNISQINPPITINKNCTLIFDLSDSSLSYNQNSINYPAFDLLIYSDSNFKNSFESTKKSPRFEVIKTGKVGIDTFASVKIILNDNIPTNLYYKLVPIDLKNNKEIKTQTIVDTDIINSSQIIIKDSEYNGTYSVVGIASTTFDCNLISNPERSFYSIDDSEIEYYTNSVSAYGPINGIEVIRNGNYYKSIPGITTIQSFSGKGSILIPETKSIGKVKSVNFQDIGFDYSSDYSIRPTAKFPTVLKLEAFSCLASVEALSFGRNYIKSPSLVVVDGLTNKIVDDVDLDFKLGRKEVKIIKNTKRINNITPRIVAVNNSNGVGISSISFNQVTKDTTIKLSKTFTYSADFPFEVGDEILVENTSVGLNTVGRGYNSSSYDYRFFVIKSRSIPSSTITFSLDGYLNPDDIPGQFDTFSSSGRVIPVKHLPTFKVSLKKNNFFIGESIESDSSSGKVQSWDNTNEILKVTSSVANFKSGEYIKGLSSNSESLVKEVINYEIPYNIDSSTGVRRGWKGETGTLNNNTQRIHDSNYYQNFSYSIKSKTDLSKWDTIVDNLNHTAGFKKFSDLIVESIPEYSGIKTDQNLGEFTAVSNIYNVMDLDCVNDYDLVTENNIIINGDVKSNRIIFNTRILQDYIESIGNRVLVIDDISNEFSSLPRTDNFGVIDEFRLDDYRFKKYFTFVQDSKYTSERQFSIVTVVHDNETAYINQYGKVFTYSNLGSFDFSIIGNTGNLLFYPVNSTINEYSISTLSFNLGNLLGIDQVAFTIDSGAYTTSSSGDGAIFNIVKDGITYHVSIENAGNGYSVGDLFTISEINVGGFNEDRFVTLRVKSIINTPLTGIINEIELVEVTSINLGNIVRISSSISSINAGVSTSVSIVGIASTYRSSRVLVQIGSTNSESSYYETTELTYVHDGSQVRLLEYGTLNTNKSDSSVGIGTYNAYIDGSDIRISFTPYVPLTDELEITTLAVSIGNSSSTSVGTTYFGNAMMKSTYTSISSSPTPSGNIIAQYNTNYSSSYYFVVLEDTTNKNYHANEIVVASDSITASIAEYGSVNTINGIGTYYAEINGSNVQLLFKPNPNINVQARVFQVSQQVLSYSLNESDNIRVYPNFIEADYGTYRGTEIDVKRSFDLYHKQNPIFKRYFDPEETGVIDLENSIIKIANHFFVTGEEVFYSFGNSPMSSPIGISTAFVGTGNTNRLPSTLYIVKIDDISVKVAASASEALSTIPKTLRFTSVGAGSSHSFTCKKQNSRVLINIDNITQSPIVPTGITQTLLEEVNLSGNLIRLSGITSIYSGDLLTIDDEIMRVATVGLGSTNIVSVQRAWMGTGISTHASQSTIKKVSGDFNIVENTIHFTTAPYGKIPFFTKSDRPDERDYVGLETGSIFNGRSFMRSGLPNTTEKAYNKNYNLDDLTDQINGITTTFILKSDLSNIAGFSTGNAIILVNNILQGPARLGAVNIAGDFTLKEYSGITSIRFTGDKTTNTYDVNNSSIPVGGIIVSLGSTRGFNYQPLVSAGGSAVISAANTITSVSIGNSGSGYMVPRSYQVESLLSSNIGIGTTVIYVDNNNSFYKVLEFVNSGSNCKIGVGTFIKDATITSVGSTFVRISGISSSLYNVSKGNKVILTVTNPNIGFVNVSVSSTSLGIYSDTHVGIATIYKGNLRSPVFVTNVATAYTSRVGFGTNIAGASIIKFDSPASYSNIPLVYSSTSTGRNIGTGAVVNINVGYGSSVIDFELVNNGFGYNVGEILTIQTNIDSTYGIPVNPSYTSANEFRLTIDSVHKDKVSGWVLGDIQVFDPLDSLFNGSRKSFPLSINNIQTTIRAKKGSLIDIESTLLIFINDILQIPGHSYKFTGGSNIIFTEAPREGDKSKILFYRGTGSIDTKDVDIDQTIKVGDEVTIRSDLMEFNQTERLVTEIVSTDEIETIVYPGPGISLDQLKQRPLEWCKQRYDRLVNGEYATKDRESHEPLVYPTSYIIKPIGVNTTENIFVDNIKTFFDNYDEYGSFTALEQKEIQIIPQDSLVSASATAIVSLTGTISSISITNNGYGYQNVPAVYIQPPVGLGITQRAIAISSITSSGLVEAITIQSSGAGYTKENPPLVFIEPPKPKYEKIKEVSYVGDFGHVVGISTSKLPITYYSGAIQVGSPKGMYIDQTGTRLFVVDSTAATPSIHSYDFYDSYDIGAIGFARSTSTSSYETSPTGISFKPDGTKMYIVGTSGDDITQVTLSTPWNISTGISTTIVITKTNITNVTGTSEATPEDLYINADGTKVYVLGSGNDRVYQFTLTQGWNFNTLVSTPGSVGSASTSFLISTQESSPQGITFSEDGKKMYIIGSSSAANTLLGITVNQDRIHQYSLEVPWEIRSAAYDSVSYLHEVDNTPHALQFNSTFVGSGTTESPQFTGGSILFTLGATSRNIFQFAPNGNYNLCENKVSFDLYIPKDSFLRDPSVVGTAITIPQIQSDYYFSIYNSNINSRIIPVDKNGTRVGFGNTFFDNVYQAISSVDIETDIAGIGITYAKRVTCWTYNGVPSGSIPVSDFYGEYSWGLINLPERSSPLSFNVSRSGISSSPIVRRIMPLKYRNYFA